MKSERFSDLARLSKISGTHIWAGSRNEVIRVQNMDVSIAKKTPRQM